MDLFEDEMIELYSSYNYHFVFFAVKAMFFEVESVDEIFQDESLLKEALDLCAFIVSKSLDVKIDEKYLSLKYHYTYSMDKSFGIVVEMPEPIRLECECNFFALYLDKDGNKRLYTSEYYSSDDVFHLCEVTEEAHLAYVNKTNTLDEFLKAIGQEKLDNIFS